MSNSDGGVTNRTRNETKYIGYPDQSFVFYMSKQKATLYKDELLSNYNRVKVSNVATMVGLFIGSVAETYISVKCLNLKIGTYTAGLSATGITSFASYLGSMTVERRIGWMNDLANRINNILLRLDNNTGIYISFNAKYHTYSIGVQTY